MTVTDTLAPLFALPVVLFAISSSYPFVSHRLAYYPLFFILIGISGLFILLALILLVADGTMTLYRVNSQGKVTSHKSVSFIAEEFISVNVTMASIMTSAVLAMTCWLIHRCCVGWKAFVIPMLKQMTEIEKTCWLNALDLRGRRPFAGCLFGLTRVWRSSRSRENSFPTKRVELPRPNIVRMSRETNTAIVLHPTNGAILTLDLCIQLENDAMSSPWRKSMARDEAESARNTIERLRILLFQKKPMKGSGQRTSREEILRNCPPIEVFGATKSHESPISTAEALQEMSPEEDKEADALQLLDQESPNRVFWKRARQMRIGSTTVYIRYNVPTITAITPPPVLYAGVPALCSGITTLFTSAACLQHEWCLRDGDKSHLLSTDAVFTPCTSHIGKSLFVRVTPEQKSGLSTQVDLPPVQPPPPLLKRWQETPRPVQAPAFRVVTYNVLHDEFCSTGAAKRRIYPFATDDVLALSYRQSRIIQELLAYHADIICLQECGKKVFEQYFERVLRHCGYKGHYTNKNGGVREGCACFVRHARFKVLHVHEFPLNWETFSTDHSQIAERVSQHVEFKEAVENVTSIAAVLVLLDTLTREEIVLGNTHLFYHANACHIRMLQAFMLLHRIKKIADTPNADNQNDSQPKNEHRKRPIILSGDFNFTHTTGGYKLVTTGCTEASHRSWSKGELFWWGCDRMLGVEEDATEEAVNAKVEPPTEPERHPPFEAFREDITVPLVLTDAYGLLEPEMPWTNYTMTFREVIDYVFFTPERLAATSVVPIPPEGELSENVALPNKNYPSDHVSLIVDFTCLDTLK